MAEQTELNLIPDVRPDYVLEDVPLSVIIPNGIPAHWPKPDAEMRRSVETGGIINPVRLERHADGHYEVVAGIRRVYAAHLAKLEVVPASVRTVAPDDSVRSAVELLAENSNRSSNIVAELEAIEGLMAKGGSAKGIARATGMPLQTVEARLRLRRLTPGARELLTTGRIKPSIAEELAKLPGERQEKVVAKAASDGKRVTWNDVDAARRDRTNHASASLPTSVFAPAQRETSWQASALAALKDVENALLRAPDDTAAPVVEQLERLRAAITATSESAGEDEPF